MNETRAPDKDQIKKEYLEGIKQKDICKKHNIPLNTLKSWIKRYGWSKEKKSAPKTQKECTQKSSKKPKVKKSSLNEVMENTELTEKQRLFCIYYIENFNATKAYQKAYDCDYQTAKASGSRMLTNVNLRAEIDRLTKECLQEQCISSKLLSKRLFETYIKIAFADITDYLEFNKFTVKLKNSNEVDGTLIGEVSEGREGIKIKLQDKMKALQWLSDRTELLTDVQKAKLDIELIKVESALLKQGVDDGPIEDDGFIEAINAQAAEVWDDEDD